MAKYRLVEWENNGYNDSDFFIAYWDSDHGDIQAHMFGTTRFGGDNTISDEYLMPTPDVVLAAREALAAKIYAMMEHAENLDINEPTNAQKGERLELIKDTRHKKVKYEKGTQGTVIWIGAFGKFYRNGYNKPGRFNRRVGLKLEDGKVFFTALSNCKRAKAPMSEAEMRKIADRHAWGLNFKTAVSNHGGWLSCNWAKAALKGTEYERQIR